MSSCFFYQPCVCVEHTKERRDTKEIDLGLDRDDAITLFAKGALHTIRASE